MEFFKGIRWTKWGCLVLQALFGVKVLGWHAGWSNEFNGILSTLFERFLLYFTRLTRSAK